MSSTLFVRNLSKHVTKADLENHFGGVGPLRRAFVVTESGSDECRGYGFVHFALVDDAKTALNTLSGSVIRGRRINLDLARKRARGEGNEKKEITKEDEIEKKKNIPMKKEKGSLAGSIAMRTVILHKREQDAIIMEEEAKTVVRADKDNSGFENVLLSGNGHEARCTFSTWVKAGQAAALAHGNEYDAVIEALQGGKRTRLIVRNLPFKIKYSELCEQFKAIAPVREVKLASSELLLKRRRKKEKVHNNDNDEKHDNDRTDISDVSKLNVSTTEHMETDSEKLVECGGYAFVEYFLVAHAKHAIKRLNGTKVGGRVIAVDMAIGKSSYKTMSKDDEEEEDSVDLGKDDKDDKSSYENEEDADTDDDDEDKEEEDANLKVKKDASSTTEELQRTVFIRNLSFETSNRELWKAMTEEFGSVEQAVVVMDSVTKRPRGTAFVRFASQESADKAASTTKENTAAAAKISGKAHIGSFMLQGRTLLFSNAVDRTKATELAINTKKGSENEDPRNMKLAWIGHIKPNTPEAEGLSAEDLARRQKAEKDKKTKLSHNPNAFISDVRLCVRNLPKIFEDKVFRTMFLLAAQGTLKGNASTVEEVESIRKEFPRITHCTIVQDQERNHSRGFGFVQFEKHEHAMKALKVVNNNVRILDSFIKAQPKGLKLDNNRVRTILKQWGKNRRLIVEFAVEDRRIVRMLEKAKQNKKSQGTTNLTTGDNEIGSQKNGDKNRPGKSERRAALKRKRAQASKKNTESTHGNDPKKPRTDNDIQNVTNKKRKDSDNSSSTPTKRRRKTDTKFNTPSAKTGGHPHENGKNIRNSSMEKGARKKKQEDKSFENLVTAYRKRLATKPTSDVKNDSNTKPQKTTPRWFDVHA